MATYLLEAPKLVVGLRREYALFEEGDLVY